MDYYDYVKINRFSSFEEFRDYNKDFRIVLLTTKSSNNYYNFKFQENDILLVGRESAGVPDEIHQSVDARVVIPMENNMRCLNVAMSLSMVIGWAWGNLQIF